MPSPTMAHRTVLFGQLSYGCHLAFRLEVSSEIIYAYFLRNRPSHYFIISRQHDYLNAHAMQFVYNTFCLGPNLILHSNNAINTCFRSDEHDGLALVS